VINGFKMPEPWACSTDADKAPAREVPAAGHEASRLDYDAELRMHNEILRRTYGIRPDHHVLEVGAGRGRPRVTRHAWPLPGVCWGSQIAKHRAKPGRADAYEQRMLADLKMTRAEPGALQFHIPRDRSDRNLFVIYEIWRNVEALREHFDNPYVKQTVCHRQRRIH
jgi:quinol monooxygenase YgiN